MSKRVTHQSFIKNALLRHPDIPDKMEFIGVYESAKKPLEVRCKRCLNTSKRAPANILTVGAKCIHCCRGKSPDEIYSQLAKTHKGYTFSEITYKTKADEFLEFTCPNNHSGKTKLRKLQEGVGCKQCFVLSKRGSLNDVVEAISDKEHIHLLSKKYTKRHDKLEFLCDYHGTFQSAVTNVVSKGTGCPECGKYNNNFTNQKYLDENKDKALSTDSGVYLIHFTDIDEYKIGITSSINDRARKLKQVSKSNVEILGYRPCNLYEAFSLEQDLFSIFDKKVTNHRFNGYTEIVNITKSDVIDILYLLTNMENAP